jgi:hypothetical protein
MRWLSVVIGIVLIGTCLKDIFHTLFHPIGAGAVSEWISYRAWRVVRAWSGNNHRRLSLAGPLCFVLIVVGWLTSMIVGFALIYAPFMSTQFVMTPGLDMARHRSFIDAVNFSIGSLITVGGDFATHSKWLRFASGIEAIFGFVLLSASLSWVLSIYPVLEQRRSVSHRLTLIHYAMCDAGIDRSKLPDGQMQQMLWSLVSDITTARNNMAQFPITYYFNEVEPQSSFAGAITFACDLAGSAQSPDTAEAVRLAAIVLQGAIHDFLQLVGKWFLRLPDGNSDEVLLEAFARDHRRERVRLE